MDLLSGTLCVSPSDLVGFVACSHLSSSDRTALGGSARLPRRNDPDLEVVQRHGLAHEARHVESLIAQGLSVVSVDVGSGQDRLTELRRAQEDTVRAMNDGTAVIFQATFLDETGTPLWRGHADFLHRVENPTELGAFGYEPEDTKLARTVKPSAVLQLCHYAEQVERIQGVAPAAIHVVLGDNRRETIRLADVSALYRATKGRFLEALASEQPTYPLPVGHCSLCHWQSECEQRWEDDDHLCRVAMLTREQARKLTARGIGTMRELAESPDDLGIVGIGDGTLRRLRHQARLQRAATDDAPPVEPLLPIEPDRGLAALPEPSTGDLFYDIEGDPFVGDSGLEYLHGLGRVEGGEFRFEAFWAHDAAEEKRAFEQLIDAIVEQRRRFPDMHVYHYAPYETTALGRLVGRYGTREDEFDDLLRGRVFVDLYRVVRQGLIVGSPSYSIKKLEPLYMGTRTAGITDAASSIVEYERWLETGEQQILDDLEEYNRDDVESTQLLRDWLERQRLRLVDDGHAVPRPPLVTDQTDGSDREDDEDAALIARLLDGRNAPPGPNDDDEVHARWLMAQLLHWHRREAKPEWWRYFDRVLRCDELDLQHDTEAVAGLRQVGEPDKVKRSFVWTYHFDPDQEHKLDVGSQMLDPETERRKLQSDDKIPGPGELVAIDRAHGVLKLKRGTGSAAPHPTALIPGRPYGTPEHRASIRRVADALLRHGIDGDGPARAARQLLAKRPPEAAGHSTGTPLRHDGESVLGAATRIALGLHGSYLPVQGPPGAGKTYTATDVIVSLVQKGQRIGITANSHAVISKLMDKVAARAAERGVKVQLLQKISEDGQGASREDVAKTKDNGKILSALEKREVDVVAGTSWLFAREDMPGQLDVLVIDEAGQLSLANVVAVSPAARNLMLVGDPQQLAQPSKGSHPPGAEASALEHVLRDNPTIAPEAGLFLDRTWRCHPEITRFISEQVYDDRLESQPHCAGQRLADGPVVAGNGLRWVPVEHADNRTSSPEEAGAVRTLYDALLGRSWTDADGTPGTIGTDDILVVAPYNAHVHELTDQLPEGARIGTVDAFQGQEAAVVIVSLAASSAEDVPRGMEFLYSRNRLNVAVSRAQAMSVLVCSPQLLAVDCRSVAQMRLANVLCRYVELANRVDLSRTES